MIGGRRWLYDSGKPIDDDRLALLSEVWDRDDLLDDYVSRAHTPHGLSAGGALLDSSEAWTPDDLSPAWQETLHTCNRAAEARSRGNGPFPSGLHLEGGDHISEARRPDEYALTFSPHGPSSSAHDYGPQTQKGDLGDRLHD